MANKVNKSQSDTGFEGIEQVLTKSERFIEDNQKKLINIVLGIVIAVLLVIGVKRLYLNPLADDAARDIFMAEKFFERDSFNLALNGFGTYPGFLQVMDDYKLTKSAKLARYYAGVSYLHLGDYENAVAYLKKFRTKDLLVGAAWSSALGDAYSGLGEYTSAVRYYTRGASKFENNFTSPILLKKAGVVYEEIGDFRKALDIYRQIYRNYPESQEGRDIEKYIVRAELMLAS
jgi:tetratricopeptide (TPR) repeat protein